MRGRRASPDAPSGRAAPAGPGPAIAKRAAAPQTPPDMRITCPDCGATYEVPPTLLAGRRPVRCARCSGEWLPAPEPGSELPAAGAAPDAADRGAADTGAVNVEAADLEEADAGTAATTLPSASGLRVVPEPGEAAQEGPLPPPDAAPPLPRPAWRTAGTAPRRDAAPAAAAGTGTGAAAVAGWLATAVVLGLLLWGGYAGRDAVMRSWPPSARAYAALGLAGG